MVVKNEIERFVQELAFPAAFFVEGRSSIADLYKPDQRCGIYILHFANDEHYCGQAVDVTRRYVQHCKTHPDIIMLRFKEIEDDQLNTEERRCIRALEAEGYKLRNIALTSIPHGESDFDLVMPPEQQQRWRDEVTYYDLEGPRAQDEQLRSRYHRKYLSLMKEPGIDNVLGVMFRYAQTCLPALRRSEMSFWSSTCLPPTKSRSIMIYSRINIFWQEVFTIVKNQADGQVDFMFHLAKSPLGDESGLGKWVRHIRMPSFEKSDHQYEPGGQDQCTVSVIGCKEALNLLADRKIVSAIRLFNLRLMQKGPCNFSRNHCLDLADRLIEG